MCWTANGYLCLCWLVDFGFWCHEFVDRELLFRFFSSGVFVDSQISRIQFWSIHYFCFGLTAYLGGTATSYIVWCCCTDHPQTVARWTCPSLKSGSIISINGWPWAEREVSTLNLKRNDHDGSQARATLLFLEGPNLYPEQSQTLNPDPDHDPGPDPIPIPIPAVPPIYFRKTVSIGDLSLRWYWRS